MYLALKDNIEDLTPEEHQDYLKYNPNLENQYDEKTKRSK